MNEKRMLKEALKADLADQGLMARYLVRIVSSEWLLKQAFEF